jgi:hypothetical protein
LWDLQMLCYGWLSASASTVIFESYQATPFYASLWASNPKGVILSPQLR